MNVAFPTGFGFGLGRVLFTLYISDVSYSLKSNYCFFVDDLEVPNKPNKHYNILTNDINT